MKKILALIAALLVLFAACGDKTGGNDVETPQDTKITTTSEKSDETEPQIEDEQPNENTRSLADFFQGQDTNKPMTREELEALANDSSRKTVAWVIDRGDLWKFESDPSFPILDFVYNDPEFEEHFGGYFVAVSAGGSYESTEKNVWRNFDDVLNTIATIGEGVVTYRGMYSFDFVAEGWAINDYERWEFLIEFNGTKDGWKIVDYYYDEEYTLLTKRYLNGDDDAFENGTESFIANLSERAVREWVHEVSNEVKYSDDLSDLFALEYAYNNEELQSRYGADFLALDTDVTHSKSGWLTSQEGWEQLFGKLKDKVLQTSTFYAYFAENYEAPDKGEVWEFSLSRRANGGWKVDSYKLSPVLTEKTRKAWQGWTFIPEVNLFNRDKGRHRPEDGLYNIIRS
ncbi:MAG: hypothetical protein LBT21_04610 [Oscillospiraceae bacterium]|jgi:hypothetical protein|nr:hypothetical protein [Oscillospiraceae bacterium]